MARVGDVDAAATAAVLSRLNLVSGGGHAGGVIEEDAYADAGARAGYVRRRIAHRSSQIATALLHPAARECLDALFALGG